MERGIAEANRVLMICSSVYVRKAESGSGGVGYERLIVTADLVRSIDTIKFIPILRGSDPSKRVPTFLGTRLYVNFENDAEYSGSLEELAREIHGAPANSKPPLGANPFSTVPSGTIHRAGGLGGSTPNPSGFLDSDWFTNQRAKADEGIKKLSLVGEMELRFVVGHTVSKSQADLLDAVVQSEIKTFGWPIGVVLQNRDEFRPRPYGDGIKSEISIDDGNRDRKSYDYWAFRVERRFLSSTESLRGLAKKEGVVLRHAHCSRHGKLDVRRKGVQSP